MIQFFLDHDVPAEIARVLVSAGYSAETLKQHLPTNATDEEVLAFAISKGMVLITCNRDDFIQLAKVKTEPFPGLIILVRRRSRMQECACLLKLIDKAGTTGIANNILFA